MRDIGDIFSRASISSDSDEPHLRGNLADLNADSRNDRALRRELAESYLRLSEVEHGAGENALAIEDVRRSISIRRELRDDCCD